MKRPEPKIWLSADLHLGHVNIIHYCSRSFMNVDDMASSLLKPYRELKPWDTVYLLGDLVFMKDSIPWMPKFPPKTYLLKGNHDRGTPEGYQRANVSVIDGQEMEIEWNGERFLLTHDPAPILRNEGKRIGLNLDSCAWDDPIILQLAEELPVRVLCGHVHRLFRRLGRIVNVGVDVWDYRPILIEDAIKAFMEPSGLLSGIEHRRQF